MFTNVIYFFKHNHKYAALGIKCSIVLVTETKKEQKHESLNKCTNYVPYLQNTYSCLVKAKAT